ncbi:hypothetical protein [Jannaschia sp. W003]|nr:hypothetical protein [Jannaschia sp. W003]UWQ21469.1 hypothetical protein K3554_00035 [Jannaschia sp. W003]
MKAILSGIALTAVLAVAANWLLLNEVRYTDAERIRGDSVRLDGALDRQ